MKHASAKQKKITRVRRKIARDGSLRLTVTRTPKHIYAQIFTHDGAKVLAAASSVEKDLRAKAGDLGSGKITMAQEVGKLLAERAQKQGITNVAFDRSGNRFHGRIRALAESVRENGVHC